MNVKKNLVFLALCGLVGSVIFVQQCKHEPVLRKTVITNPIDTTKPTPVDTSICFERDILPLFVNNCAKSAPGFNSCHDAAIHKEGLRLYTYSGIRNSKDNGITPGDPANSKLFNVISNGFMNSTSGSGQYGNLTKTQIALIKRWILEGALDGKNCPSRCDTNVFTYSGAVSKIMADYCHSCHSGSSPSGGANFDTYAGIIGSINKGVFLNRLQAINGSIMPQAGKLEDCKLTQIKKWINAGKQNN